MNITELRNKRAALWNTMEGFLDTHRNDMGVLSAEDDATYTRMEQELDALTNEVKRMERRDAHEAELSKPVNRPITGVPEKPQHVDGKVGRASDEYKEDFGRHLRGRPLLHNVLSTSPDEDGGYLVPVEYEKELVTALTEEKGGGSMENLLERLKQNLILEHSADDALLESYLTAAIAYAESYQHIQEGYYSDNAMPATTEQAVIMLASHFYESRDGSTAGFFADNPQAAQQVWHTVNLLLRLDRNWKV